MTERIILNKVRKLLALTTEAGATPAEAAAAAARAQELLLKHNLSMMDLPAEEQEEYDKTEAELTSSHGVSWRRNLYHIIARGHLCAAFFRKSTSKMTVIGKPSNVEVVNYLYAYLSRELLRQCKAEFGERPGIDIVRSFMNGATEELRRRLKPATTEGPANVQYGALVVQTERDLKEALKRFGMGGGGRQRAAYTHNDDAYLLGKAAGATVAINKGVGGGPQLKLGRA